MNTVNCALVIPEVTGLISQQITVGRHFLLQCRGEFNPTFDFKKAELVTNEANKYEFKLVRTTSNKSEFVLDCVSYLTGELKTTQLSLTDGENQITANIQAIKVDSILKPQEKSASTEAPAKPQEPYGFIVSKLDWPWVYTLFFGLVFCAVLAFVILKSKAELKMKRLLQDLNSYDSAVAPDSQFYKSLRQLEKKNYPIDLVYKQFQIYVIRRYQVPLFGLSLKESVKFLKQKWPTLKKERLEIKNILLDLKALQAKPEPESTKSYLNKLYQFVDNTEDKFNSDLNLNLKSNKKRDSV